VRILKLAFLAPDITATILEGRQPTQLTAEKLNRMRVARLLVLAAIPARQLARA
jgi:hypothetical protein